jgi:hypothetical protein
LKNKAVSLAALLLVGALVFLFRSVGGSPAGAITGITGTAVYLPVILQLATPTLTPTATETPTPTISPTPSDTPTQTATNPPSVYVSGSTFAFQDVSYVHIIGEVYNDTSGPVELVKIRANLYDDSHQLMATDYNFTFLTHVPVHEKACFDVSLSIPSSWSTYELEPPTYFSSDQDLPRVALVSTTAILDPSTHHYELYGQVRNDEPRPVHSVKTVGTLYNGFGIPIGCNFAYVGGFDLSPTQTGSYHIYYSNRNYSDTATWQIQVDGDIQ